VEVGPGIQRQNLTLDAAITCSCSTVTSDKADVLSRGGILLMLLMTLFAGLLFINRENAIICQK